VESRQTPDLERVLEVERGRYEDLRVELAESGSPGRVEEKVGELRRMVQELERQRGGQLHFNYPGIERLRVDN
jgi:hypothetical protein